MFSFLILLLVGCRPGDAAPIPTAAPPGPRSTVTARSVYAVRQRISLINEGPGAPEKQHIWVALIPDFASYQQVQSLKVSPRGYTLVTDEQGNRYAEFDFSSHPPGTTHTVEIEYRVEVAGITYDLAGCQGELELQEAYTQPELHIESANPQIAALAEELSRGQETACQQARAFYDFAGDALTYTYNGENWGAQAALGPMGADCTEYAALLAALSRARGIPARYFEGLLVSGPGAGGSAPVEHAWVDVYLPGAGWVAADPTLGRHPAARETYFARYPSDRIIVTLGASPSVLRGSSYWTHLYWPGDSTRIRAVGDWQVEPAGTD